jgi:hypothetical protein
VGEEGLAANGGNLINKAAGTTATEPATIPIMSGSCTEASQRYPATVGPRSAPIPAARLTSRRPLTGAADVRTAWVWLLVQKNARAIPWTNWDATKNTTAGEIASSAHEIAIISPDPTRKDLSGIRRINAPMYRRVISCAMAATATSSPISLGV